MTATLEPSAEAPPPPEPPERRPRPRPQFGARQRWDDAYQRLMADTALMRLVRPVLASVVFLIVIQWFFDMSLKDYVNGVALGSLYGIVAVGLILIYRTNRIINFAAVAVGAVPAIWALLLDVQSGYNYLAVLPIVLIGGPLMGAAIDIGVMRRFSRSPRLITTVVTIGVARGLAAIGFFIPVWMGAAAARIPNVPTPWADVAWHTSKGKPILSGDQVAALVTVMLVSAALGAFLRYTRIGIALRASAENADRAALLGIPVKRVGTVAWMLAGLLGGIAIFVQAPLIGVPNNATLGFDSLLYGLAAAVVARMERIGIALLAGAGTGILIFGSVSRQGDNNLASALMLLVILGALLLQRGSLSRAMDTGVSTWQAVKHFRPVPSELRNVPEVQGAKWGLLAVISVMAVAAPFVLDIADVPLLIVLPIFAIVAVSLVVLTGWAGQISLGQFGLVGMGAGVAGGLVAKHNIDFFVAIGIGIAVGVVSAVIIGLPAVRIQGMYLAVTTLAFGFAVQNYVLNKHYWIGSHLLPKSLAASIEPPVLYGRLDLANKRTFYFVCLAFLLLSIFAASSFRKNRSGRILIAARDNQRAAPAYSINLVRTRLAAFAVSGGMAGMAGVLFAYSQGSVSPSSYDVQSSLFVFLAVVIGGLTSVPFAVAGAVLAEGFVLFSPRFTNLLGDNVTAIMPLLLTGPLLVLNLYFYPGGTAENGYALRDKFLRWVARRRDIHVPSLVADRLVEQEQERAEDVIVKAEQHVEEVESFDVIGTIACPVCGAVLTAEEAMEHDHFKPGRGGLAAGASARRSARRESRAGR
ncbi:MAG: branched-chain amino acid transport system permease protein livM [Acidimicrobiaceae bacterium]|nr:branched-chain amino acid transport system permease protein livM [Acidimicrobiaceae bacterium]